MSNFRIFDPTIGNNRYKLIGPEDHPDLGKFYKACVLETGERGLPTRIKYVPEMHSCPDPNFEGPLPHVELPPDPKDS